MRTATPPFSLMPYRLPLILQQIIAGPCHGSAGSRRLLIPEARFQSQSSPCEICGEKSGTGTGFSRSTSVFISPPVLHAHTSPTLHNLRASLNNNNNTKKEIYGDVNSRS